MNTLPEAPQATLLTPYRLGQLDLRNRVVMSPMTRARSVGGVPVVALESQYLKLRPLDGGRVRATAAWCSPD